MNTIIRSHKIRLNPTPWETDGVSGIQNTQERIRLVRISQ